MTTKNEIARIVEAQPGFQVGTFFDVEGDLDAATPEDVEGWFEPVIAWAITVEFNEDHEAEPRQFVRPISPKGDMSDDDYLIILPDGRVKRHFDESPVTMGKAKELFLEEKRARRKR